MSDISIPQPVLTWKLSGRDGNVRTQSDYTINTGYNLQCRANGQFLTYVKQTLGVNLGYVTDAKERKVHFRLPDGSDREIVTGERIAFGIGGKPSFLKYKHRDVGINLAYADDPAFEWRIYGESGQDGEPVPTEGWVAILNEKVEPDPDFLIHFGRPGADVGWTTSPQWWETMLDTAGQIATKGALVVIKNKIGL